MHSVVIACYGVPPELALEAAEQIAAEFAAHRHWHKNVRCSWDGTCLILVSENNYDPQGEAAMGEFSDCVAAFTPSTIGYRVSVASLETSTQVDEVPIPTG